MVYAIELRDVTKSYTKGGALFNRRAPIVALRETNMKFQPGSAVALIGESGSGKSTVAKLICGLTPPDSGQVYINGVPAFTDRHRYNHTAAATVQIVFQNPGGSLNPRWRVGRCVEEGIRFRPRKAKSHTTDYGPEQILKRCGLSAQFLYRYPHELSGGQRQRVAIARALAAEPQILVLDEPTSALDVSIQAQILLLLQSLRDSLGLTFILISHDLTVVETICEYVYVMKDGTVIEEGACDEVVHSPSAAYTRELLNAHPNLDPSQARIRPRKRLA